MKFIKWVLLSFLMLSIVVYAKRSPAPIVPDVVSHDVRYHAAYNNGGVVQAFSKKKPSIMAQTNLSHSL